jgi:hypothetical protein
MCAQIDHLWSRLPYKARSRNLLLKAGKPDCCSVWQAPAPAVLADSQAADAPAAEAPAAASTADAAPAPAPLAPAAAGPAASQGPAAAAAPEAAPGAAPAAEQPPSSPPPPPPANCSSALALVLSSPRDFSLFGQLILVILSLHRACATSPNRTLTCRMLLQDPVLPAAVLPHTSQRDCCCCCCCCCCRRCCCCQFLNKP